MTDIAERVHRGLAKNLQDVDLHYGAFLCQIQDRITIVCRPASHPASLFCGLRSISILTHPQLSQQCLAAAQYERQESQDIGERLEAESRRLELVLANCHDLVREFDDLERLSNELCAVVIAARRRRCTDIVYRDELKRRLTAVETALDGLP